ncbi:MAG TPA: ABC transporter ATP-binding protein [Alphaproteobacteria bacterium]|nr:ABC transporter ATP-binding protein [Alphaproteobacteria bacterium]
MFRAFEKFVSPTGAPPATVPPQGLVAFYWHFARQAKGLFIALFAAGLCVAVLDSAVPVFIGHIVTLVSTHAPDTLWAAAWPQLVGMALVLLLLRPLAMLTQNLLTQNAIAANVTNLVRWQSHWHVVRQNWSFFQDDFAGRIANRVMQTGPSLRESIVLSINTVWYIVVYGTSAMVLLSSADPRLASPLAVWAVAYVFLLRYFVPRLRDRAKDISEMRSWLTGRIVDTYTNILTVKLFARAKDEDDYVREAVDEHTQTFHRQLRLITLFSFCLTVLNVTLVTSTAAIAIVLWTKGQIDVGAIAMALPLSWQILAMAGWVAFNITAIFENIGTVQEGIQSIAQPHRLTDRADAKPLVVPRGEIRFENVRFGYGRDIGVIQDLSLAIKPGERVGLIGHSGAGKSTLVNLLLRFFEPESGRILIDGQDIGAVTQESLRTQIAVVTQDTSLLHRSIRENIGYGRPESTDEEILAAAKRAHAHDFIADLVDWKGRTGYDAHVGERGVKLSGGQRQRIAIARVILKNAPILVLDEATSALDSEVEAAIQEQLADLMEGKTVIAIAHRLSTIARMDRLVVLDKGRIVEEGPHAKLLAEGGAYAKLWQRQSGGFVTPPDPARAVIPTVTP